MNRPFRLMFDAHTFDTGWQGTTTYLAGLLNALPEAALRLLPGTELQIYCAAEAEAPIRAALSVDFTFVPIRSGFLARNAIDLPREAKRVEADLVVSQYVRPFHSPCATFSIIHDVLFLDYPESFSRRYRAIRRAFFGWSARHSTYVATVSRYSAERIAAHFGISSADIVLTPNAVTPMFRSVELPDRRLRAPLTLLSVSRLEQRKRHEWGIYALDRLADAGIVARYIIIGGGQGTYSDMLLGEIETARMRGLNVELRSGVPYQELVKAFAESHIFLCPSEAEGFGIPVIEAAAAGIPCVVSDGGALSELTGEFIGLSFAAKSLEEFLAAVTEVAQNIERLTAAAQENRDTVADHFSWSTAAETFVQIIRDVQDYRE